MKSLAKSAKRTTSIDCNDEGEARESRRSGMMWAPKGLLAAAGVSDPSLLWTR
jgi:hypothetical protein